MQAWINSEISLSNHFCELLIILISFLGAVSLTTFINFHNFPPKFSFVPNLPLHFSKMAAPCCFKTRHKIHCWRLHLNLFWFVASSKIEQQLPNFKLHYYVHYLPGTKKMLQQFFYIEYQVQRSQKKPQTRVQTKVL